MIVTKEYKTYQTIEGGFLCAYLRYWIRLNKYHSEVTKKKETEKRKVITGSNPAAAGKVQA